MKPANAAVIPFPNARSRRDREEIEFLPAALEIVEAPPSPIGRAIGVTIVTLFCLALAWAAFGKIDIVASAPGKIIASGRTKTIQPFETGVVRAIRVHDGQAVKAGDVLIELDTTMNMAERNHLESDLIAARLDIARLRAALSDAEDPTVNFHPPEGASPQLVAMTRQFLINQVAEHRAKVAGIEKQQAQKAAERATTGATITKLESTIPVVQQRVDIRGALYNREFGSKLQYLETLQLLIEQQQDLGVQKNRLQESEAAIAALAETRRQTVAEFHRNLLDELNKAEAKANGLVQDVAKAEQRAKFQTLTAPVDGVVQQLAIHTIGGVVTPAQALLVLVPEENHLEIEAMISNRDIGFVHPGQ
ncbi:MAG TPA: HlyD family type I secretion periplasmic adaptor subunit, partial [Xanthobacteraceae bacterium]